MALKIVLLALLVYCASEAQSQGDDTALPLSYNATETQGDGATCPNDQLRQETQENITNNIGTLLQDTVIPLLGLPTPEPPTSLPQCPCTSEGRRIAYLDMTDPNQECPQPWREIASPRRTCGRTTSPSCESVYFPTNNSYSRVCGRVTGYQQCSPDGFFVGNNIDDIYADGVSITHGSPRQHVWTFAAGHNEGEDTNNCPCISNPNSANSRVDSFVGDDYFCDTALAVNPSPCGNIATDPIIEHPLWDGGGCGPTGVCCENNDPPWFCATLPQPTTDYIEVRICADEPFANEDIVIELIEIYINVN